jgi:hypothetical protein
MRLLDGRNRMEALERSGRGGMMSRWRDTCVVHPAADVFPMMSDEEINDLAADIKKHGLARPIVFYVTTKPGRNGDAALGGQSPSA